MKGSLHGRRKWQTPSNEKNVYSERKDEGQHTHACLHTLSPDNFEKEPELKYKGFSLNSENSEN